MQKLKAAKKEMTEAQKQAEARNKELADAKSQLVGAAESRKDLFSVVEKREKTIADLKRELDSRKEKSTPEVNPDHKNQSAEATR